MKRLTIITICRNIADTIGRTCESIVNQTFQDFEWIVVDGASTDGTIDILKKYSRRIDILISEPDKGVYNAMNKGIKLASGEYINFMNGGDEFYETSTLEKVFQTEMTADVVYGYIFVKGMNKNFFHKTQIKLSIESIYKDTISHPSSFVKKEILHKYYFDEKYKICADYDFFTKIYLKGIYSFHREDLPIAIFYFDGISSQNHKLTQAENEIIHKKYYSFFQRYRFDSKFRNEIQNRISHYKMILTHPRYIAGWIKRKIFK